MGRFAGVGGRWHHSRHGCYKEIGGTKVYYSEIVEKRRREEEEKRRQEEEKKK